MNFPLPKDFNLVVAGTDADGNVDFLPTSPPALMEIPAAAEGAWFWRVDDGHRRENVGRVPEALTIAGPNGSTFGVMSYPAHSAGKLDLSEAAGAGLHVYGDSDPSMHYTHSIDYEVVLAGKVDIELPGGKVRTLAPGDLLVVAGVPHAWKNHYDEDCLYIVVTVGLDT